MEGVPQPPDLGDLQLTNHSYLTTYPNWDDPSSLQADILSPTLRRSMSSSLPNKEGKMTNLEEKTIHLGGIPGPLTREISRFIGGPSWKCTDYYFTVSGWGIPPKYTNLNYFLKNSRSNSKSHKIFQKTYISIHTWSILSKPIHRFDYDINDYVDFRNQSFVSTCFPKIASLTDAKANKKH